MVFSALLFLLSYSNDVSSLVTWNGDYYSLESNIQTNLLNIYWLVLNQNLGTYFVFSVIYHRIFFNIQANSIIITMIPQMQNVKRYNFENIISNPPLMLKQL